MGQPDSWIPSDGWLVEDAVSCVSGMDGQSARAVMGSHPPSDQLGRILRKQAEACKDLLRSRHGTISQSLLPHSVGQRKSQANSDLKGEEANSTSDGGATKSHCIV